MQRNSLTFLEIEQRTGIKKSSMQRYVSGETGKIPLSAIEKLATLFGVSGAYLMGWDEEKDSPSEPQLTEGEKMLLDLFNRVPKDQQQLVLQMIRAALGNQE
ncbi:MAG: helix-turn-helix domain-containing protein [Bacteroidales bacterium]|nr:helix-turn-helix domain-containing protein [Bacteroidales bacterium]